MSIESFFKIREAAIATPDLFRNIHFGDLEFEIDVGQYATILPYILSNDIGSDRLVHLPEIVMAGPLDRRRVEHGVSIIKDSPKEKKWPVVIAGKEKERVEAFIKAYQPLLTSEGQDWVHLRSFVGNHTHLSGLSAFDCLIVIFDRYCVQVLYQGERYRLNGPFHLGTGLYYIEKNMDDVTSFEMFTIILLSMMDTRLYDEVIRHLETPLIKTYIKHYYQMNRKRFMPRGVFDQFEDLEKMMMSPHLEKCMSLSFTEAKMLYFD